MKKSLTLLAFAAIISIAIVALMFVCEYAPILLSQVSYYIGDAFTWMLVLSAVLGALALFLRKAENQ